MKRETEIAENFNKSSEAIKHFEQLLKSPRSNNDTSGLGFTALKKVKHQRVLKKEVKKVRTQNPIVITIIRKGILVMFVGVERPISITHPKVKDIVTNATSKDI